MKNIIVIGGGGQLGQCLQEVVKIPSKLFKYIFLSEQELNITNAGQVKDVFEQYKPAYCINCAAYTAVDQAEEDVELAHEINELSIQRIAEACRVHQTVLIHISTDFVFDGKTGVPLREDGATGPINVYGLSKLKGEQVLSATLNQYFILRTSWLYSEKANNFCKTMLKLAQIKDHLQVISDQVGTPTYAIDLAKAIVHIIHSGSQVYGVYHYSNEGVASWYDFAKAIFEFAEIDITVTPVNSDVFVTKATRPHYSVLDKTKFKKTFGLAIPYWRDSLNQCINNL
ncbi:dTDP-4-dehydrorhamnose reductase [Pedobacter nutrimenti]|uniref:dTDP-4-dehydrorhamnose reductase n=1 Tax=Pedobacter nutrimenti TaxID=1241337 RepID=A0A318UN14_9SPHI|nr:dTDP-4-dehydrorhamnose reductase [Pedobacter nutrimenti]PYF75465.1 dTDP-4-dehydrorhamnose reductase [Pedobacter nutrimenti]